LTEVALPDTFTALGEGTFQGCNSLTTLFIAASTTTYAADIAASTTTHAADIAASTTTHAADIAAFWNCLIPIHIPGIERVWAPDAIVAVLGGPFQGCTRYVDLPPALQAAPAHIQTWSGIELWRWWTPPDAAGAGEVAQFRLLSAKYRATVWTVLLICERCAAMESADNEEGTVALPTGKEEGAGQG
jgi:hypothetical protein